MFNILLNHIYDPFPVRPAANSYLDSVTGGWISSTVQPSHHPDTTSPLVSLWESRWDFQVWPSRSIITTHVSPWCLLQTALNKCNTGASPSRSSCWHLAGSGGPDDRGTKQDSEAQARGSWRAQRVQEWHLSTHKNSSQLNQVQMGADETEVALHAVFKRH